MCMRIFRSVAFASFALCLSLPALAQESAPKPASAVAPATPRNITIDDYFQIREVSQPELSPDGQWVAYAVRTRMLKEDKNEQRLWMISNHGGDPISLTAEGVSSSHPRWSPDGKYIAFLSARNNGKAQVLLLNRLGGEAAHLTDSPQGVDDFEWSPDSTRLVLILRDPKPEDLEAAKEKDKDRPAAVPISISSTSPRKKPHKSRPATSTMPSPPGLPTANPSPLPATAPLPIPTPLTTRTSGSSLPIPPTKVRTSRKSPPIPVPTARPPGLPMANGSPSSAKPTSRP